MAVEIRELVIKASVGDAKAAQDNSSGQPTRERDLVRTCVAEVLKILQREKER